jgi:hypothetical protein
VGGVAMTLTKSEALRELRKQIKRWSYMVTHYGWQFTVLYHESAEDMPEEASPIAVGYTVADFRYLHAVIHFNLRRVRDLDKHDLEYVMIHELTHLLICPIQQEVDALFNLEYVVTSIAKVFQGLRKDQ